MYYTHKEPLSNQKFENNEEASLAYRIIPVHGNRGLQATDYANFV